jgi:hypothetical protein
MPEGTNVSTHHQHTVYHRDGTCLLRGTNLIFKYNSIYVNIVGLKWPVTWICKSPVIQGHVDFGPWQRGSVVLTFAQTGWRKRLTPVINIRLYRLNTTAFQRNAFELAYTFSCSQTSNGVSSLVTIAKVITVLLTKGLCWFQPRPNSNACLVAKILAPNSSNIRRPWESISLTAAPPSRSVGHKRTSRCTLGPASAATTVLATSRQQQLDHANE